MSALLNLAIPITLALVILVVGGRPSDFETMAGASGAAIVACYWVGAVFLRRWVMSLYISDRTERDRVYTRMLLTMSIVAVCVGWLLTYRYSYAAVSIAGMEDGVQWFLENRLVGSIITIILGAAMASKLYYSFSVIAGRWWLALAGSIGILIFFTLAYLPRLL